MGTVPILEMDLRPMDRSPSQLHTFQSGDQSSNHNQYGNILHSKGICVRVQIPIRVL